MTELGGGGGGKENLGGGGDCAAREGRRSASEDCGNHGELVEIGMEKP